MRLVAEVVGWVTIVLAIAGAILPDAHFVFCFGEKDKCLMNKEAKV